MQRTALPALKPIGRTSESSQRLAWGVLLLAFAVFLLVCLVTSLGVNYFLTQSTVQMSVALNVGRGTAAYLLSDLIERVAPAQGHYLSSNERVWTTDPQSQATLLFQDSYSTDRLIASVTMKNSASVTLGYAQRPRFDWSNVEYRIDLVQSGGEVDVYIPPGLERAVLITIQTSRGVLVYMTSSGQYTINANDSQVRVFNREGHAIVISPVPDHSPRDVPVGQVAVVNLAEPQQDIVINPGPINLLQNAVLQTMGPAEVLEAEALVADLVRPWQCGDIQSEPPGEAMVGVADGRPGIRLFRGQGAISHGETSCSQTPGPGQTGRDVTGYSSLIFKTSFLINSHSLDYCGQDGSECPLGIQIDYVYTDELGQVQPEIFYHGFYVNTNPSQQWPRRCSSCLLDHENIYNGTWYTYESDNLFSLIPEGIRPESILRVKLYASGHQYDVYIGDAALYAS